jgi:CRP-like cAMP-binding protein
MSDDYYDLLAKVPIFEGLDKEHLDRIGQVATLLDLGGGQTLMAEGSVAHEMVVVLEGTLEITLNGEHIADLGPVEFAGEMALLNHTRRNSSVLTKTDVSVLHIDGRAFATVLEDSPHIAVKMLPTVASRVTANSISPAD